MARIIQTKALDFSDVLLVPQYSMINSRGEVSLSTCLSRNNETKEEIILNHPLVSANMDTITGELMLRTMNSTGGTGILHRYMTQEIIQNIIQRLLIQTNYPIIPSVGIGEDDYNKAISYCKVGATGICIDVAHGHHERVISLTKQLRKYEVKHIIVGNIATKFAARDLIEAGATALKVGLGNGAVCKTRNNTGAGVPQLTAIMDVAEVAYEHDIPVIADGGLTSSGDCVKALAAGASTIMSGSLFKYTDECPIPFKYRGMASKEARKEYTGKEPSYIEGISEPINKEAILLDKTRGSVVDIIKSLLEGIRSGFSYCNARNMRQLWSNAEFITK